MTWMTLAQFIDSTLRASTPIALAALGAVFAFRAGIFFLGLEGLMLVSAFAAVAGTTLTGSVALGLIIAIVASMVTAVLYWVVIVPLKADQIIAGLGLSILGLGATSFALAAIFDTRGAIYVDDGLWRPVTGADSGLGAMVTDLSVLVWATPVIVFICWVLVRRTRFGLQLSAAGEFPFAARSAGVSPGRMKLQAMVACSVLCALAGSELALGSLRSFTENITQGQGFIAFTAAVFGGGLPIGSALAALFFGAASALGIQTQMVSEGLPIPREVVLAVPYLLTIIAVWYASVRRSRRPTMIGFGELRDE